MTFVDDDDCTTPPGEWSDDDGGTDRYYDGRDGTVPQWYRRRVELGDFDYPDGDHVADLVILEDKWRALMGEIGRMPVTDQWGHALKPVKRVNVPDDVDAPSVTTLLEPVLRHVRLVIGEGYTPMLTVTVHGTALTMSEICRTRPRDESAGRYGYIEYARADGRPFTSAYISVMISSRDGGGDDAGPQYNDKIMVTDGRQVGMLKRMCSFTIGYRGERIGDISSGPWESVHGDGREPTGVMVDGLLGTALGRIDAVPYPRPYLGDVASFTRGLVTAMGDAAGTEWDRLADVVEAYLMDAYTSTQYSPAARARKGLDKALGDIDAAVPGLIAEAITLTRDRPSMGMMLTNAILRARNAACTAVRGNWTMDDDRPGSRGIVPVAGIPESAADYAKALTSSVAARLHEDHDGTGDMPSEVIWEDALDDMDPRVLDGMSGTLGVVARAMRMRPGRYDDDLIGKLDDGVFDLPGIDLTKPRRRPPEQDGTQPSDHH